MLIQFPCFYFIFIDQNIVFYFTKDNMPQHRSWEILGALLILERDSVRL